MKHFLVSVMLATSLTFNAHATTRPYGDAVVFTTVASQGYPNDMGFPEGLAVDGDYVYVGTPGTTRPTSGSVASKVKVYNRSTGAFVRDIVISGQNLSQEHNVAGMTFDTSGRLYVLETQQGILRFTNNVTTQESYSSAFPNLPSCTLSIPPVSPCSPTLHDLAPLTNDLAFDEAGIAYVTDTNQATIWKVPAGGGAPQIWFQDARIGNLAAGPNGIRMNPARTHLYFNTTLASTAAPSGVWRLPIVASPSAADLQLVHAYLPGEGPDGLAFGDSGRIYVALAPINQISVLRANGTEKTRIIGPATTSGGTPFPFDGPANIVFLGNGSFLMTNSSNGPGNPLAFAVIDVFVNDNGATVYRPTLP